MAFDSSDLADTLEDASITEDIEHYHQREKELEEMFNSSTLPQLPEVPLSHCDSVLEKVGLFYECAFNWLLTGKFTYTNPNLPW